MIASTAQVGSASSWVATYSLRVAALIFIGLIALLGFELWRERVLQRRAHRRYRQAIRNHPSRQNFDPEHHRIHGGIR